MKIKYIFAIWMLTLLMVACTKHPSVPTNVTQVKQLPLIFPEYTDVTITPNIAPLNFKLMEGADECVARITAADGQQQTYGAENKVLIDEEEWKNMLSVSKGKSLKVEVFGCRDGIWTAYHPFNIYVAKEDIDEYCSYRVIMPSYVAYEMLSINQRNLTNFDEREIYNNMIISPEEDGQCINCHSYQNYGTNNMQFHMRQGHGGTMIVRNGKPCKVDLKTDSTISAGVYPAWHPTQPLIAYSTNHTGQSFHTKDLAKIEVEDSGSDLILYDIDKNQVTTISNRDDEFECFPCWAPDGRTLYFCSAHFEFSQDTTARETQVIDRYDQIKYDIYRKSFNPKTKTFGPKELVYAASKADTLGMSATFPRVSPDGRYILFGQGRFGCFHVWHPDADLYLTDLKTMQTRKLENVNSRFAESYHSWSSNGRWIIFISRRDDNNFSRLYIAYFDKQGKAYKAFELPQEDPDFYGIYLRSFNVPEFMKEPVTISAQTFAEVAKKDALKAKYVSTKRTKESIAVTDGNTAASLKSKQSTDGNTAATPKKIKKTDGTTSATPKK
mgnify:CR=1 FL=1